MAILLGLGLLRIRISFTHHKSTTPVIVGNAEAQNAGLFSQAVFVNMIVMTGQHDIGVDLENVVAIRVRFVQMHFLEFASGLTRRQADIGADIK